MEVSGVERRLREQVRGDWSLLDWSAAVAVDMRPGRPGRVLNLLGVPGVVAPPRPLLRGRTSWPVVVGPEQRHAEQVNRNFRMWLAGKPGWVDPGWYAAPMRAQVQALCRHDPGPQLLAALKALRWNADGSCPANHSGEDGIAEWGTGRPGLPCACLVVAAAAWDAMGSWTAHQASGALLQAAGADELVVDADRELGRPVLPDPAREDLAAALRISPGSAYGRIETARRLAQLPAVSALVEGGHITHVTGKLIAAELRHVRPAAAQAITEVVADRVRARPLAGLRPWGWRDIKTLIAKLKAGLGEADLLFTRAQAKAGRRVCVHDEDDEGMATVCATVSDVDAHRIYQRLTAIAEGLDGADDPRSKDQKRADVFVDLLLGNPCDTGSADPSTAGTSGVSSSPSTSSGGPSGAGGEVDVVVTLDTLLGLAEDPAHLEGLGPIPADVARELAADRRWRAWITDTCSGLVIATSATTYRPGAALRRLIEAQEPRCRYPGCPRRSRRSDHDHTTEWPEGLTTRRNLGPLCRRHHIQKTHHGYHLTGPPDDPDPEVDDEAHEGPPEGWTWTTPSGITIQDEPEPPLS